MQQYSDYDELESAADCATAIAKDLLKGKVFELMHSDTMGGYYTATSGWCGYAHVGKTGEVKRVLPDAATTAMYIIYQWDLIFDYRLDLDWRHRTVEAQWMPTDKYGNILEPIRRF